MPYQRFAHYASLALVLILLAIYLSPQSIPDFIYQVGHGLAAVILLAFGLNTGLMVRDIARNQLIILYNITFYAGLIGIIILAYLAWQGSSEVYNHIPIWWILAIALFQYTANLFRIRMDAVGLAVKLSPAAPTNMTWFDLCEIEVNETSIEAMRASNSQRLVLPRQPFTDKQWKLLSDRFSTLS